MKTKLLFLSFLTVGLAVSGVAFGAIECTRTPGATIYTDNTFEVHCTGIVPATLCGGSACTYLQLKVAYYTPEDPVPVNGGHFDFVGKLTGYPSHTESYVDLYGSTGNDVDVHNWVIPKWQIFYNNVDLFDVVNNDPVPTPTPAPTPTPTPTGTPVAGILSVPSGMIPTFLAFVGQFTTDLAPYIALLIGLPLAFWIIYKVLNINKKK